MRALLVVLVLMFPIASVAQVAPAVTEVEQVMKAFLVPFSNQVVADFIDYFADDAVVFFPSAQFAPMRVEGKVNIARTFESVFKPGRPIPPGGRPLIQPQDLKIWSVGDTAIVTFHLGNDTTRGRRTFVLQRINSKWRIVHLHASTVAAP
ncbi:MAG TPA: nuclear transport factor 2 family protein [Vicinamibacterales bacterium]